MSFIGLEVENIPTQVATINWNKLQITWAGGSKTSFLPNVGIPPEQRQPTAEDIEFDRRSLMIEVLLTEHRYITERLAAGTITPAEARDWLRAHGHDLPEWSEATP